jgi:hypothetical protein
VKIFLKAFVIAASLVLLSWVVLTREEPGATDPAGLSNGAHGLAPGLEDSASGQELPAAGHQDPAHGHENPASGQENLASSYPGAAPYYVVAQYDEARNPAADLGTSELEEGSSYTASVIIGFLDAWKPGGSGA